MNIKDRVENYKMNLKWCFQVLLRKDRN